MAVISVRKVSAGTVYKLIAIGLVCGFLPLFTVCGILATTGVDVLLWNGQSVTGLKALFIGPLMALFMALIFTGLIGSFVAFGLWLYAFIRPLRIEYVSTAPGTDNR